MQTRVAAYGVIVREGLLLLSHWTEGDRWTLPGGGLDPGEDPADAAVREILEETGYVASLGGLLGVSSLVIPAADRLVERSSDLHAVQIVYEATVVGGELAHETEGSSDEARWFGLDELADVPQVALVRRALEWLEA